MNFRTIIGFPLSDEAAASAILHYAQHQGVDGVKFKNTAAMVRYLVKKQTGIAVPEPGQPWSGPVGQAKKKKPVKKKKVSA